MIETEHLKFKRWTKMVVGTLVFGLIAYVIILAKQNYDLELLYLAGCLFFGFLLSFILSKFDGPETEVAKNPLQQAHDAVKNHKSRLWE